MGALKMKWDYKMIVSESLYSSPMKGPNRRLKVFCWKERTNMETGS